MEKNTSIIDIDTIRQKAASYIEEHCGSSKYLFTPMFRKEKGKYYLCFVVIDFIDEENNNYNVKRPTKWLLVDIVTGDLVSIYDSLEYDFSDEKTLPFNKEFDNNGSSKLYDSSNHVLVSFSKWKKQVIEELNEKYSQDKIEFDQNVLRINDETISPNTFVLANIDSILETLHEEIMENIANRVQDMYKEQYIYLIDSVRKDYIKTGQINTVLLDNYIKLEKYSWPDFIELIDAINNIF